MIHIAAPNEPGYPSESSETHPEALGLLRRVGLGLPPHPEPGFDHGPGPDTRDTRARPPNVWV